MSASRLATRLLPLSTAVVLIACRTAPPPVNVDEYLITEFSEVAHDRNPEVAVAEEELSFVSTRGWTVHGTLTLPEIDVPAPAVVLLHGSGRSHRDSSGIMVALSEYLASRGIAALRYDSPGTGKSDGDAQLQSFAERAEEADRAIARLRAHRRIASDRVGLWGISQGGWIALLSASGDVDPAFVVSVSGPGVSPAEQGLHEIRERGRRGSFDPVLVDQALLMRRLLNDFFRERPRHLAFAKSEAARFGPGPWDPMIDALENRDRLGDEGVYERMREGLVAWTGHPGAKLALRKAGQIRKDTPEILAEKLRRNRDRVDFDPRRCMRTVRCPVLALFGEADPSIPVAESIAAYRDELARVRGDDVTIHVFPGAGHGITVVEERDGRRHHNTATGYFWTIREWLLARFSDRGGGGTLRRPGDRHVPQHQDTVQLRAARDG